MGYAVRFEEVTKRYPRGGPRYPSLRHELAESARRFGQRLRGERPMPRGTMALDRVSFDVEEGEAFALIGPNGAGKSTALKLVSRISYPTGGRVRVRGRVAALIEVGSGVHPELTARENIWLYGQILGMPKSEIRRRFDDIVGFAELAHVLDTPVKMYSSGMQLRLGFAIASHLDPDVFVVDEALAVGDAGFQAKCVERMTKLVAEGHTVVFVSHNLPAVESLCARALLLDRAEVRSVGTAREVIAGYLRDIEELRLSTGQWSTGGSVRVVSSTMHGPGGEERYRFRKDEPIELRLRFEAKEPLRRPHVNVGITDGRPGLLVHCSMLTDGQVPERTGKQWECRLRLGPLPLRPRLYQVYCDVYGPHGHGILTDWQQVLAFRIEGDGGSGPLAVVNAALAGAVDVPYSWTVTPEVPRE